VVQKKNFQSHKFKNKNKFGGKNKASHSTSFRKKNDKKKGDCRICCRPDHWSHICPNRFDKRQHGNNGKAAHVVIGDTEMKEVGYNIFPTILLVCHSPEWWIDTGANTHVCSDISIFSSYQVARISFVLIENG
jgi:hypothetical protein